MTYGFNLMTSPTSFLASIPLDETFFQRPKSIFQELIRRQWHLPPSDKLCKEQLKHHLNKLLVYLEENGIFLEHTDHLSDRALYRHLQAQILKEHFWPEKDEVMYIDILGECTVQDIETFYKFYADKSHHPHWKAIYPNKRMPRKRARPYKRDRY